MAHVPALLRRSARPSQEIKGDPFQATCCPKMRADTTVMSGCPRTRVQPVEKERVDAEMCPVTRGNRRRLFKLPAELHLLGPRREDQTGSARRMRVQLWPSFCMKGLLSTTPDEMIQGKRKRLTPAQMAS